MIKVFIIDDSLMVRNALYRTLKGAEDIEIIGEANNPVDAFATFKKVGLPDVFILDIEMPKMDGLSFLKQINTQKPTPVIICSTLVTGGSNAAIKALELGACDIILKPKLNLKEFFNDYKDELLHKIYAASHSKVNFKSSSNKANVIEKDINATQASKNFIAIGSSTGGVQVIEEILMHLKPHHQGIVITQHMPVGFTASFAQRLNSIVPNSKVIEASDGDIICEACVYIAKGGIHMQVEEFNGKYIIKLTDGEKVNSHKPSVNVLFNSIALFASKNITAFILTGMGDDGAKGLKALKDRGCDTYAQNEKTATVYGMPRVAVELGAAKKEMSIFEITKTINSLN